jgi:hypothetical protein
MPGRDILLQLSGRPKVERVLHIFDAVEALGIDPADATPDYWHHVRNRPSVDEVPLFFFQPRSSRLRPSARRSRSTASRSKL